MNGDAEKVSTMTKDFQNKQKHGYCKACCTLDIKSK